jgi:soluble lytic murein transglycosylase
MTSDRSRPFVWYRVVILLVVAGLATVTLLATHGPLWFQRLYHPLQYSAEIRAASRRFNVDPYLIAGVMKVESGFDASIVSPKGAVGLMQLLPSTADELHSDPKLHLPRATSAALRHPGTNALFGAAYLSQLMADFDDTRTALAAYNAGPNNVAKWVHRPGGKKMTYADVAFPETKRYVKKVLFEAYYYRRLYPEEFK